MRLLKSTHSVRFCERVNIWGLITCSTTSRTVGSSRESKNFEMTAIKIISESLAPACEEFPEAFIFILAMAAERITNQTWKNDVNKLL